MKRRRITKIWSVGLTLALLAAMLAFAAPQPVEAAPGDMAYSVQALPTASGNVMLAGSDVSDIAAANDGTTVYAISSAAATGAIYKSTNAGQSFTLMTAPAAVTIIAIAVASDAPEAIVVCSTTVVYTSNNGGTTWSALPVHGTAGVITDVAVGPARAGTLLGREYAIALADVTTATIALGDVMDIGGTATWASSAATTGIVGTNDYMAVAFSPNFVGDRCLAAIGSDATFPELQIMNTATNTVVRTTIFGTTTIDFETPAATAVNSILAADIALPMDWDPTTTSGQRTYVTIAAFTTMTDNDVYRIDGATARALGAVSAAPLHSVTYAGTIDEGTLLIGRRNANTVQLSTNPQVSLPTWTTCKKSPGMAASTNTIVRVASDFTTTSRVFAGTTGAESAFEVSDNGGISFNGESLIDNVAGANNVVAIDSIALSADGSTIFMATNDAVVTNLTLWRSATPVSSTSWSRIWVRAAINAASTGMVRLNPDWADAPVVYFADIFATGNIYRAGDGGEIFATRTVPAAWTSTAMAVEDANTIHIGNAGGQVRKSTTGAWTWGLAKAPNAGAIVDLIAPKADHLIVGGTACVSYSTDGASTFTRLPSGLVAGATYQIAVDDDYENNNTIYAGGNNAAVGNILRFVIGTDSVWEGLGNGTALGDSAAIPAAAAIVGLDMASGVLYGQTATLCFRNLTPTVASATVAASWNYPGDPANAPLTPAAVVDFDVAGGSNALYAANAVITLWAFDDVFATETPALTSPGDGATVGIDPVTGRADIVTMTWNPIGSGTAAGNRADMRIKVKGESWAAAVNNASQVVNAAGPSVTMAGAGATWIFAMRANTEYEWQVRFDRATSGDIARTNWSDTYTIKVQGGTVVSQPHAGPVIIGPEGSSAVDTSLTPGIAWAPYAGATKYQIVLATDPGLKNRVAGTPVFVDVPAWQPTAPLAYDTTYFFAITAVEPTVSPQAIGTFATMAKAAPPPPAPLPPVTVKEVPAPVINIPAAPPAAAPITPAFIWAIVIIGAILIIAVLVLIVRTRRPM